MLSKYGAICCAYCLNDNVKLVSNKVRYSSDVRDKEALAELTKEASTQSDVYTYYCSSCERYFDRIS